MLTYVLPWPKIMAGACMRANAIVLPNVVVTLQLPMHSLYLVIL